MFTGESTLHQYHMGPFFSSHNYVYPDISCMLPALCCIFYDGYLWEKQPLSDSEQLQDILKLRWLNRCLEEQLAHLLLCKWQKLFHSHGWGDISRYGKVSSVMSLWGALINRQWAPSQHQMLVPWIILWYHQKYWKYFHCNCSQCSAIYGFEYCNILQDR